MDLLWHSGRACAGRCLGWADQRCVVQVEEKAAGPTGQLNAKTAGNRSWDPWRRLTQQAPGERCRSMCARRRGYHPEDPGADAPLAAWTDSMPARMGRRASDIGLRSTEGRVIVPKSPI